MTRKVVVHEFPRKTGAFQKPVDVDARPHAHLLQHIDQILRCDIPRRSRRIGAAAETADGGIVLPDPRLQTRQDVREAGPRVSWK